MMWLSDVRVERCEQHNDLFLRNLPRVNKRKNDLKVKRAFKAMWYVPGLGAVKIEGALSSYSGVVSKVQSK